MWKATLGVCLTMSFSTACSPVADTYCARAARIVTTGQQVIEMKAKPGTWRSLAEQLVVHNQVHAKHCE